MDHTHVKMVGPVIRGLDANLADAVITAIETDNPDEDVVVDDQGGYIRIGVPQRCRVTRASLEDALGLCERQRGDPVEGAVLVLLGPGIAGPGRQEGEDERHGGQHHEGGRT